LQFAKVGSAATLPQQEKNHSVDVQRGGFFPHGDVPSAVMSRWPIAKRRVRHYGRMFDPQLHRLRLRHKTSAWASGGPAGGEQNHHLGHK